MGLWPTGLTAPGHVESSHSRVRACVPHVGRHCPTTGPPGKSWCKLFSPLNLFIFSLRTTTILFVSAIYQHGSAIAILMSPPLWKSFNSGILCSSSCPCRSGHNVPLSAWQDKSFCLFCHFLISLRMASTMPFRSRALIIVLVPQSCLSLCDPMGCSPPDSSVHGDSPGKDTGMHCQALLQEIFKTQGLNLGLLHCSQSLYWLSDQGSMEYLGYTKNLFIYLKFTFN